MTTSPIRVLTLDSTAIVHAGVQQLLRAFPDIKPAGEAYSTSELSRLLERHGPAVVLVEIDDLGRGWGETVKGLAASWPASHFIVFTTHARPEHVRTTVEVGLGGYLLKRVQALTLAQALRSVAVGQQVFHPEATQAMLSPQPERDTLREEFSQREREVLALMACGLSNDAIGARLYISRATVKFHCSRIFAKLGVETRAQAIGLAFRHNLVPRGVLENAQQELPSRRDRIKRLPHTA